MTSVELRLTRQTVAHLFPMNQVFAMKHRHSREILECAVHQIEILTIAAYAWISVEARKHRVSEPLSKHGYAYYSKHGE